MGSGTSTSPLRRSSLRKSKADEKRAKELFAVGNKAFDEARYKEALASYKASYGLVPRPSTAYNIAQCHDFLGESEQALVEYQRFLSLPGGKPDLIADAQARVRWVGHRGRLCELPAGPYGLLTTRLLGPAAKLRLLLGTLRRAPPEGGSSRLAGPAPGTGSAEVRCGGRRGGRDRRRGPVAAGGPRAVRGPARPSGRRGHLRAVCSGGARGPHGLRHRFLQPVVFPRHTAH